MKIKTIIHYTLGLALLGCISACKPNSSNSNDPRNLVDSLDALNSTPIRTEGQVTLIVSSKIAVLRAEAGPEAAELTRLSLGAELQYLQEVSSFTTPMRIEGIDYDEPWIKAQTVDGKTGWIYGGNIRFNGLADEVLAEMVFDRRLLKLFGEGLTEKIKVYQKEMRDVQTIPAFRMLYRRSDALRLELNQVINEKLALAPRDSLPDFFWVNEAFPGFLVHLIPEKNGYKLYRDFRYWAKIASNTPDTSDNQFMEVFLHTYQSDSIEYLFPDWQLVLDNQETYSLLGRGLHKTVLDKIELALKASADFEPELNKLKQLLLNDISLSKNYWEKVASISKELDSILVANYSMLSNSDKVELKTRRKMFDQPKKHGIRVNLFEGQED